MFKKPVNILVIISLIACSTAFGKTAQKPRKVQRVTIALGEGGYRPSSFHLRKGIGAKLTFIRKTDATCGQEIVIPDYGIRRDLPLNQPVTVTLTPKKSSTFNFTCGMNMLRGKIIVR